MTHSPLSYTQMPSVQCLSNGSGLMTGNGSLNCSGTYLGNTSGPSKGEVCNTPMDTYNQIYQLFLIAVLIVSFGGNSTVVIGILNSRALRSSVTNMLIVSLAVSDIGVTFFLLPIKIDHAAHKQVFCRGLSLCIFWNMTDIFFSVASVTHLIVITVDRYLAVSNPFSYPAIVTHKKGIIVITLVWLYSVFWSVSSLVKWDKMGGLGIKIDKTVTPVCLNLNPIFFTTVYVAVFIIPLVVMGVMYFIILKAAIKQARAITSLEVGNEDQRNKKLSKYRREIKATKTIAVVYGAFLLCWLPVCIISISGNWCRDCYLKLHKSYPILHKFIYITFVEVLPPLNSALNPFIYVIFGKQFRAGFAMLLYKLCGGVRRESRFLRSTVFFSRDRTETHHDLQRSKLGSVSDAM